MLIFYKKTLVFYIPADTLIFQGIMIPPNDRKGK